MLRTKLTELLGIDHPIVLGGMASGTNTSLVAAVSAAGGLGVLGATNSSPEQVAEAAVEVRRATDRPFGLNLLLFLIGGPIPEAVVDAVLRTRPRVFSTAWGDPARYVEPAHRAGALVMHMVATADDAARAVESGVDVIVAQGTEGGGHVGHVSTIALVPAVVDAARGRPVVAAGGIADGRGLAAALMLGADGVLMGTRFLATPEAPVPPSYKQAIVEASLTDTVFTQIPDLAPEVRWPGALSRVLRNRFVERWLGREEELRRRGAEAGQAAAEARARDDREEMKLFAGQSSGLIGSIEPAGQVVRRVSAEAEAILRDRLPQLVG
ncbi:MAG TPA: nitronate monooxygenase [Chloroflexota bacterium]|jgi:NAD(P)H-dependent flavin oxidoreductase YrpB (nitropropane dioxygenase family)|nr:nitronate monooxygenase [Chloroflexota bacterium]